MYIKKAAISNFRSFAHLKWEVALEECAGWHVLLGENGSGKSSMLQAIALGLNGQQLLFYTRRGLAGFARRPPDGVSGSGPTVINLWAEHDSAWDTPRSHARPSASKEAEITLYEAEGASVNTFGQIPDVKDRAEAGWYSAAFGPLRRLSSGEEYYRKVSRDYPVLARHLSLFEEDFALTDAVTWLQELQFRDLDSRSSAAKRPQPNLGTAPGELVKSIRRFLNQQGVLPHGVQMTDITPDSVFFKNSGGITLPMTELSDGYRATLSLILELIRGMSQAFTGKNIFSEDEIRIEAPGVVLIDEVDVHLHPTWQRDIGPCLTRMFPNVQFIVTTHSPLICQAAVKGSIWKLSAPGEDAGIHRIEGEQLQRVLYGDVLHALNSEAFGGIPGRSDVALAKMRRFAELNQLAQAGKLKEPARLEQEVLRRELEGVLPGLGR